MYLPASLVLLTIFTGDYSPLPTVSAHYTCTSEQSVVKVAPTLSSFTVEFSIHDTRQRCRVQISRPSNLSFGYYVIRINSYLQMPYSKFNIRDTIDNNSLLASIMRINQTTYRSFATTGDTVYLELTTSTTPVSNTIENMSVRLTFVTDCPPDWYPGTSDSSRNFCYGIPDGNNLANFAESRTGCRMMRANLAVGFDNTAILDASIVASAVETYDYWVGVVLTGKAIKFLDNTDFYVSCRNVRSEIGSGYSENTCSSACPHVYYKYPEKAFYRDCAAANELKYICSSRRSTGDDIFNPDLSATKDASTVSNTDDGSWTLSGVSFYWTVAVVVCAVAALAFASMCGVRLGAAE